MSVNSAPDSAAPDGSAVAGLAREVEALQRRLDILDRLAGRVDELAVLVSRLAENVTVPEPSADVNPPADSWLDFPTEIDRADVATDDAEHLLTALATWVGRVYLRYGDAIKAFPDCWLWHPEIVEELLWLHRAWSAAYSEQAAPAAVGDWHERQRPGVLRRIREYAGVCSLEAHLPGGDLHSRPREVPVVDAIAPVTRWWVTGRAEPGPVPTHEQLSRAELAARNAARSRR